MAENDQESKKRKPTFITINAERWITSSTRYELTIPQRLVWVDFLVAAANQGGVIEVMAITQKGKRPKPYFKQLANYLNLPTKLVEECVALFSVTGKLTSTYCPLEKKFYFEIVKWRDYQFKFLWDNRPKPYIEMLKKAERKSIKKRGGESPHIILDDLKGNNIELERGEESLRGEEKTTPHPPQPEQVEAIIEETTGTLTKSKKSKPEKPKMETGEKAFKEVIDSLEKKQKAKKKR